MMTGGEAESQLRRYRFSFLVRIPLNGETTGGQDMTELSQLF